MAKIRQATPVTLTDEQHRKLERLWFIYGNYEPKTTPGNHSFIQGLLERGRDERPMITKRTPKSEIPTPECKAAVEEVLKERGIAPRLRVVSSTEDHPCPSADPELKAILDDMRRSYAVTRQRFRDGNDTPDAA